MAIYLYCRISQKKQNIDRQKRNLKEAFPDGVIVEEAYSGRTIARPQWTRIYKAAAAGDTIVFDSVSRMSRNAEEGAEIYQELYNRGVNLVFLKEPHINTDVYRERVKFQIERITGTGSKVYDEFFDLLFDALQKLVVNLAREQIRLAFEQSEKEVSDLSQRTKEGLQTARLNGKHIGVQKGATWETKKAKEAKKKIVRLSAAFEGSNTDEETWKLAGIAKKTYYKYKKELLAEREAAAAAEVAEILKQ